MPTLSTPPTPGGTPLPLESLASALADPLRWRILADLSRGEPRMVLAIGRASPWPMAAKAEILVARIADRPFAGLVGEMQDGDPAAFRQIDEAHRLRFRQRLLARLDIGPQHRLQGVRSGRRHAGRGALPAAGEARFALFARCARLRGARRLRPARQIEAVNLADHRIACDARAQPPGNLAGTQAFRPELLQKLHPIISPGQFCPSQIVFKFFAQQNPSLLARPI